MPIGHIRYNGRNLAADHEKLDEFVELFKTAQPGANLVFTVDDGQGKDVVVWTYGTPISFHYWEHVTYTD